MADDTEALGVLVIEEIRQITDLTWNASQSTALSVISILNDSLNLPQLQKLKTVLHKDCIDVDNCNDADRIRDVLTTVQGMHSDVQERAWALHEDVRDTVAVFETLDNLLEKSDPRVPLPILMTEDDGRNIDRLVDLYQSEQRRPVRHALLKVFKSICLLSPKMPPILLSTMLPIELSRDLTDLSSISNSGEEALSITMEVISLIYSTGDPLPLQHYDILMDPFVSLLAHQASAESAPQNSDPTRRHALNALIAFNLHGDVDELTPNPVPRVLCDHSQGRSITNDLVSLANRAADPVWPYETKKNRAGASRRHPHSVLKLISDIFSHPGGQDCFYSTDLSVLIEICLREIQNLPPDAILRPAYLDLLITILKQCEPRPATELGEILFVVQNLEDPPESIVKSIEDLAAGDTGTSRATEL